MRLSFRFLCCSVFALQSSALIARPVAETWEEAHARLEPLGGTMASKAEIRGKVVAGYQGWFAAEGDGSGLGWVHYGGRDFAPGNCHFDLWPDMSELEDDEKFPTPFKHADGSTATLFSSYHPRTVSRHFKWMRDYGIDGVMLQRFGVSLRSPRQFDFGTTVMQNVRQGAALHDRNWAMMYDLSGMKAGEVLPVITADWKRLVLQAKILDDPGYLHHEGKPLVSVWGVGFSDGRNYGLDECAELLAFFKEQGCAVKLGVPYYWRDLSRDSVAEPILLEIIKKADIVSPWSVGRYQSTAQAAREIPKRVGEDLAWCAANGPAYLPVIFPGFSWQNLQETRGRSEALNAIPRDGGNFLWQQAVAAKRAGAEMIYIAMFDEVDEGTAILKATNHPPVGESSFITYEDLPSDHYLWLGGEIGKMIRGELPATDALPKR